MMLTTYDTTAPESAIAGEFNDSMYLERRKGVRVKIARPVRIHEPITGRHMAGRTRDISASGLRIEMPITNAIRVGETISVVLGTLSNSGLIRNRKPTISARVVWIKRDAKLVRPMLTAGVEFTVEPDAQVAVA
jgi:c-di-GMP-binding flagellar brake protein YcgR